MKYLLVALALIASNAFAYNTLENPHEVFNVTRVNSNNITVTFITATNIQKTCDAESKKRGYGGFPMAVEACSFWDASKVNNRCTIVVGQTTNYHTIGHEMRHCLQGNYHK
jgi:hypothetical protein